MMIKRFFLALFVATCSLICVPQSQLHADELVIPSGLENVEGDGNNGFPFNIANFGLDSMRYQQVYGAADFIGVSGPILITELKFRPDGPLGRPFSRTLTNIQINLSTTTAAVDGLSFTFAENVGADDTIVYSGSLALSSNDSGTGPRDFDIVITLDTPFVFNPTAGNLLLDVRNFDGGFTTQFDAHNDQNDETSRVATNVVGDVDSSTAAFEHTSGLVTKFCFEPASIAVTIDVKPGSNKNPINLKSNSKSKGKSRQAGGVFTVAILTTEEFDATTTDVSTVLLSDPGLFGAAPPIKSSIHDADGDGDDDLVFHFSIRELVDLMAIDSETILLQLTGATADGLGIEGVDLVTVKP